jgi:hypothetical protein
LIDSSISPLSKTDIHHWGYDIGIDGRVVIGTRGDFRSNEAEWGVNQATQGGLTTACPVFGHAGGAGHGFILGECSNFITDATQPVQVRLI